jgi:hypothetical protein
MAISLDTEQWLQRAGYEYHCFISWAHTPNRRVAACVKYLKQEIEEQLALSIHNPQVFLDERDIAVGDEWQRRVEHALCRSVALIAVYAPIYYRPPHLWCGREWAGMHLLSQRRLQGRNFTAIIPVMVKPDDPHQRDILGIQCIDFSKVTVCEDRYFKSKEFRKKVEVIVERIETIAEATAQNSSIANCDQFQIPQESAFADYRVKPQPFPRRS